MNSPLVPPAIAQAQALLERYRPGMSYFASPKGDLLASAKRRPLADIARAALPTAVRELAQASPGGVVMGSIPFASEAAARLFAPEEVWRSPVKQVWLAAPPPRGCTQRLPHQSLPSAEAYCAHVADAVREIQSGTLEKVVLARSLKLATAVDLAALLRCLACRNPQGFTYAIDLAQAGEAPRALLGASPELLLARQGTTLRSQPFAGSIPRSPDALEDARRAAALLQSAKDRHEHAVVVAAVEAAMRPFCSELVVPAQPTVVATPSMWHLASEVVGRLADPAIGALDVALALHPTPAVCGQPPAAALAYIQRVEGFDRGLFTGLVGWQDASGDGEWAVTIRCAELSADSATLYAGAGIVAASEPAAELAETTAKFATLLSAMGVELEEGCA